MTLRIAMVAGEASGDLLGAGLIRSLRMQCPDILVEGVAGPKMLAEGAISLFPIERLSVMGLAEVVSRLPELFLLRRRLIQYLLKNPPDIFVGIDAPDFNFSIERRLKKAGITTVHYNSPTVWAWRKGRLNAMRKCVDKMLTLFPFEAPLYEAKNIPVCYVGHPLADEIQMDVKHSAARAKFNIPLNARVIALLPGSRASELKYLSTIFIQTAMWCLQQLPDVLFIAPMINTACRQQFAAILQEIAPHLPIQIIQGSSHDAMAASNVVLSASGTATLEAALLKRPLVVAHCISPLTYMVAKQIVKTPYIALPNILAAKKIVPEFIQSAATPAAIGNAILQYFTHPSQQESLLKEYEHIHQTLRCNASERAAKEVLSFLTVENVPRAGM